MSSKREKYLEQQEKRKKYIEDFLLKGEALEKNIIREIVEKIFYIGEVIIHTHKYNVWLAREAKNSTDILNDTDTIIQIVDWANNARADIFKYDFKQADLEQEEWHYELNKTLSSTIKKPKLDTNRIIFKCSDEGYFFYLLKSSDLKYEGYAMGHCVGGENYANALNNKEIYIISLRDAKNEPHVTIEISRRTRRTVQIRGKGNAKPIKKYAQMVAEFGLWASGYNQLLDNDILKILNLGIF